MKNPRTPGRTRITRTVSLFPSHEALLAAEAQARTAEHGRTHGLHSVIVQDLIEEGLGGKPSKRFARIPSTLAQDCYEVLKKRGWDADTNATVGRHTVDLVVTKGKRTVLVLLAERTLDARLENVLGNAMLVRAEANLPVVVCTPYILDRGVAKAFEVAGSSLCTPPELSATVGRFLLG